MFFYFSDIEQLHNVYNEIGQVEMRFKEGESLDKPDLSQVYIGDRFYLYLKYMGGKYLFRRLLTYH